VNRGFRSLYLRQVRVLEAVLRQACAQGQVRCPRPDAAAFTIYEMTRGLITRRLLGWSKASADEDVEFLCELIWKGLSAHEEAYDGR
jgi:hypothetical protein